MRSLLASLLVLLTCSCATTVKYEERLATWIGQPADKLVTRWGPPQSTASLSTGGRVLEYVRTKDSALIAGVTQGGATVGVGPTVYSCRTLFTITPSGLVESYRWSGDGCAEL